MKIVKCSSAIAVCVVLSTSLLSAAPSMQDSLRTAKVDIKKFTSQIKKGRGGKTVLSAKLGEQDYAFAAVKVNSGWKRLGTAARLQTTKSWWNQWAALRARYDDWVAVTVYDSQGRELNHCYGDSRGNAECSSNGKR